MTTELDTAVARRLGDWQAHHAARRIWDRDPSVWADPSTPEITDRLGWLDLPSRMQDRVARWEAAATRLAGSGVGDVVLLGMGGSSLAPEVLAATLGSSGPRLLVLDTTHPDAIGDVSDALDPATTAFVVSSKSGGTLETLSLFRHFWAWRRAAGLSPGPGFVAVTDPGSGLARLGVERGFGDVFEADPEVGGRFSALSDFGLVPFALCGGDPRSLLDPAEIMERACGREIEPTAHVGLDLGAWLGEAALAGRDKLTILTSSSLAAFPAWWEQLAAESTGKEGKGIVPVPATHLLHPDAFGPDRVFLVYHLTGDPAPAGLDALEEAGFPVRVIHLQRREEIGAEMYRAEFAVAAAGAVLGVNPFDQPDVEAAKASARELLDGTGAEQVGPFPSMEAALASVRPGSYVALMAFLPMRPDTVAALGVVSDRLTRDLGVPVTVGFGPRFLHSTGQLHKGGPPTCVAIQVVDDPTRDLPIPETDLTFGQVIRAQADGDAAVLAGRGVVVARTTMGDLANP